MQQRNQRPALLPMAVPYAAPPSDPYVGMTITHTPTGVVMHWGGSAWASLTPGVTVFADPGTVSVRRSVTVVASIPVHTDPNVHDHSDGIVMAVADGLAFVRSEGEVPGFAGLNAGEKQFAGISGTVTNDPNALPNVIPLGSAMSATVLRVKLDYGLGL